MKEVGATFTTPELPAIVSFMALVSGYPIHSLLRIMSFNVAISVCTDILNKNSLVVKKFKANQKQHFTWFLVVK